LNKKKNAESVGVVLKSIFEKLEAQGKTTQEDIETAWKIAAGSDAARHTKTADLKKTVLLVRVDSPAWMQELTLRKRNVLKELKRQLGKDTISEIHFKIGEF
jgi:predicted nucleic acid-binding Zn ribbon protein